MAGKGKQGSRGRREGWTLLEIVISTVILLTLLVGFSFGLASSTSLGMTTREQGAAREAARGKLEEMRGTAFDQILARFDADPANDPDPASPGASFDVQGLTARADDPDGRVGEIVFPLSGDGELREDLELPRLGLPRDLSGEGDVDGLDHALDYRLLPVLVRLQWRGASGNAEFEMLTMLKRMRP
jgi:type II secretory pathway pseudopilin PulG